MTNNLKTKNVLLILLLILAVGFVVGAYYYSQVSPQSVKETPTPTENTESEEATVPENLSETPTVSSEETPEVSPTPRPIPHGTRSFVVSVPANTKGPKIGKGTIDPYDPALNGKQTVTIEVNDTIPVDNVVAILQTDNKTVEHALSSVTPGQAKGNWSGTWTVDDTYLYVYNLSVKAISANGTTTAALTTR